MNKEKEIETVTLMVRRYCWACMGQGARHFARRVPPCWNTPGSGGTDARTGKFSGALKASFPLTYAECVKSEV